MVRMHKSVIQITEIKKNSFKIKHTIKKTLGKCNQNKTKKNTHKYITFKQTHLTG